jgi:membrane protease YdiL (CAAX protease family)
MISRPMRRWTMVGLALALFSMPFVIGLFTAFRVPLTTQNVLLREIILFALAALVLFIIRRKERLGWDSVGLQRPALHKTLKWALITFIGVALALSLAFGFIKLFKLPVGSSDSQAYDALPTWVLLVVIIRAGFVEELFYRGYAIERLQNILPFNPQGLPGVAPDLAFNTAMSFTTNTNWQNYGGESTMSHLTQMAGLAVQNFVSAAMGIAVLVALIRGIRARSRRRWPRGRGR